jgi:peptidyl-Lys metalloendopeptidase
MGAIVKRVQNSQQPVIELQPGESFSVEYSVDSAYDMSAGGRYDISFVGSEKHLANGQSFDSTPTALLVESDPGRVIEIIQHSNHEKLGVSSYSASCSSSQRSSLATALNSAVSYANNAVTYLAATPSSSKTRYVTWFGSVTTSRWNTVKSHFANIKSTFDNQNMSFDCGCTDTGTYAYVYPSQPYTVYLCGAFWSAPNTGTDSRAGTLVHETSHFTVVAGTKDNAYGQTAAKKLAKTSPTKAVANADSHEYFAENNPFQN